MTARPLAGVEAFTMTGFDFDEATGRARLRYGFDDVARFEEVLELGTPPGGRLDPAAAAGLERALRLVHLAAGVSYYKAAAPGRIVVETGPLSPGEEAFVGDLYDKGLREFAVANGLEVPRTVAIEHSGAPAGDPARVGPPPGVAVPVGGGKDSIVVLEALAEAEPASDLAVVCVAVNAHPAMVRTAEVAGRPLVRLRRRLAPELSELNAAGALNGHVPVTAVVSLVVVAAGYVHGYDTTLVALERSADEATRLVDGVSVNHQWSKSAECRLALRQVVRESVAPSIEYHSPLHSCGELEISRYFAGLDRYHPVFRSCNRAFRQAGEFDGWCGACPKCRFVFLMLAPFLEPAALVAIFGRDLLDDASPESVQGFRDLFAEGHKPFECVGEQRESLLAFLALRRQPAWRRAAVVVALGGDLDRDEALVANDLGPDGLPALREADATRERIVDAIRLVLGRAR